MATLLTVDEFRAKIDESRVKCALCSKLEHSLVRHLKENHSLSVGQYQKKYPNHPITSRILTELSKQMTREAQTTETFETFLPQFIAADTDELFGKLRSLFKPAKPELKHLIPPINPNFVFEEKTVKAVAFSLYGGKNVYAEGPTGCGKTDGIKQIHAQLGLPVQRVNMNGDVTAANFIGKTHADPQKGTYFKQGNLPMAMKGGYTLLIDEIDYMPPNIAAVLNPVLEGAREIYLSESDEHIKAEQGFCVIGTANTGGKGDGTGVYTGTEVQNTAFLDRFAVKLTMDYLAAGDEAEMLQKRFPALPAIKIQKFVQAARDVREQFKNGLIPVTLSTRKLIDIFEMESALGLKEATACAILNWLDEDNKSLVTKILDNRGIETK